MKKTVPFKYFIALLIMIDQVVKLIILNNFMTYEFNMIANIFTFQPIQNLNQSYAGNFIALFSNQGFMIIVNVIAIILFISGYQFYRHKKKHTSTAVKVIMIFGLAGCFCSLIDKVFWGGSLDYVNFMNFFTFDLKDCYLTLAELLFVVLGLMHSKELSIKEFLLFYARKLHRNKDNERI